MNTINKKNDRIMVDLETLGKRAGCAILSIGAVTFSAETGIVGTPFYMVVNASSCALYGLHSDPETLAWWDAQSDEAKRVLRYAEDYETSASIKFALAQFNEYVSQFDNPEIWGNGSDFDNAILIAAMAQYGIEPAWKFWNNRCFRTLKNMYPEIKMDRHGTYHNALDDAITQAKHAMAILKQAGSVAGFKEAISTWKDATPGNGESNIEAMIQRINWLEKEVTKYDNATSQAISERDDWEGLASDLAHQVGDYFRVDVGEHSSGNCPVKEAIAVLNEEYITDSNEDRRIKKLESALKNMLSLVSNDAFAARWQTSWQYRSALINCINQEFKDKNIELNPTFDLVEHLYRQRNFSVSTFGPGCRTAGVINHIRKELIEIENAPADVTEWIDVALLAFDGAWRAGHSPEDIAQALFMKQRKNESRTWPDWRTADLDAAIEHVKGGAA